MNSVGIPRKIIIRRMTDNNRIINPNGIKFDMGCGGIEHPICNQKTRLCKNWSKPIGCPFGENCHYAHSMDELRIMDCAYASECVFIDYTETGICVNKTTGCNTKTCYFRHPRESDTAYHNRIENKPKKRDIPEEAPNYNLTPIKIDITPSDMSWSTVVRKNRNKVVVADVNNYSILGTKHRQTFNMPNDEQDIYDYIRNALKNKIPLVKFEVTYK